MRRSIGRGEAEWDKPRRRGRFFGTDEWIEADRPPRSSFDVRVVPAYGTCDDELTSNTGVLLFKTVLFSVVFCATLFVEELVSGNITALGALGASLLGFIVIETVHIAQQWEKVVVLRLGRFHRVAGPGLYLTVPFVEQRAMKIDQRVRTISFFAEETLTSDLVPVNVDAVLFWMVWDAKAACTEVGNFERAVELAAQTTLRDAIGRANVNQVAIRREQLDHELKQALEEKVSEWGISILSVEVRDIVIPHALQDAMSLQAQAKQRASARMTLMETEDDICDMLVEQGTKYRGNDEALRLRAMHLLYESVRETGGTVVLPSSFAEGFGDILPDEASKIVSKGKVKG